MYPTYISLYLCCVSQYSCPFKFPTINSTTNNLSYIRNNLDLGIHMDQGGNGDGEWLELGLGFTRSSSSSSSSSSFSSSLGLGLGLGLGMTSSSSNYDPLLPSLTWFSTTKSSSSSSSPWPWPIVSAATGGLRTPVIRSPTGLWFNLVSSINRNGDILPQVPMAYIRVRDDNVTILMVQKYLVAKLGLSNETERRWRKGKEKKIWNLALLEIDISCIGEKLLQSQTLRHVWNSVWLPRIMESEISRAALVGNPVDLKSMNYLMSLHYGRRCFFN